jgi:hypothetical protein
MFGQLLGQALIEGGVFHINDNTVHIFARD